MALAADAAGPDGFVPGFRSRAEQGGFRVRAVEFAAG